MPDCQIRAANDIVDRVLERTADTMIVGGYVRDYLIRRDCDIRDLDLMAYAGRQRRILEPILGELMEFRLGGLRYRHSSGLLIHLFFRVLFNDITANVFQFTRHGIRPIAAQFPVDYALAWRDVLNRIARPLSLDHPRPRERAAYFVGQRGWRAGEYHPPPAGHAYQVPLQGPWMGLPGGSAQQASLVEMAKSVPNR